MKGTPKETITTAPPTPSSFYIRLKARRVSGYRRENNDILPATPADRLTVTERPKLVAGAESPQEANNKKNRQRANERASVPASQQASKLARYQASNHAMKREKHSTKQQTSKQRSKTSRQTNKRRNKQAKGKQLTLTWKWSKSRISPLDVPTAINLECAAVAVQTPGPCLPYAAFLASCRDAASKFSIRTTPTPPPTPPPIPGNPGVGCPAGGGGGGARIRLLTWSCWGVGS